MINIIEVHYKMLTVESHIKQLLLIYRAIKNGKKMAKNFPVCYIIL